MVMHGDAWWWERWIVVGDGGKGILDDSWWFWNHLESIFTIFYNLLHTDRHRFLYIDLAWFSLTEWFCSFLLKTTNKPTKWFIVFWKMSIHSSQIGLVLQNGFVFFWGGTFTDGFMCWTTLQNGFDVFQKNEKHQFFSRNTTKWFYIFWADLARDWGLLYKMVLVLFKNQRVHLQNGL